MTTATTPSPLETYQQSRDEFLAVVLHAMSGIEGAVLSFENVHESKVRAAATELSSALQEVSRLEGLTAEQAAELRAARSHACTVPASEDFFARDSTEPDLLDAQTVAVHEETVGHGEDERTIADLRSQLAAEQRTAAALRDELAGTRATIASLREDLGQKAGELSAATENHTAYIRESEAVISRRLEDNAKTIEAAVRGKAVLVVEAIAADNPGLADVAELFSVAFPVDADGDDFTYQGPAVHTVPAEDEPVGEFFADGPEQDARPEPMTQMLLAAPDLDDDAILDPHFFDTPPTLDEPDPEDDPAAHAPEHGAFGRKKEDQHT